MSDLGAAFGFFPQMKPRRQGLPSDSANLPIDVLRGRLAGLLGAPADIANLLRSPSPTEMFGDVSYDAPAQFPYTTEKFLKELPLTPTSRVGQAAGQAASFVPLNPMPAVRGVQKVGQVVGEELAATMLGQRPNTMMSKVVPQPLFAVPPEGLLSVKTEPIENLLQVKPQAPVSDIGFYSATEQAALNLNRNKGTGQSFINDIMKAPDVKKEELQFTGLDEFLRDKPNVTKQEVQDYLANNRVDVQEVRLGEKVDPVEVRSFMDDEAGAGFTYDEAVEYLRNSDSAPRYEKYQLAGGENYREILLTLPEAMPNPAIEIQQYTKRMETMRELQNEFANAGNMEKAISFAQKADDLQAYIKQLEKIPVTKQTENYQSSHFDQPNILAHIRVNDRVDADGKKMLLIEEIQSDWHQAGRERGYQQKAPTELPNNLDVVVDQYANNPNNKYIVLDKETGLHTGWSGATPEQAKATWLAAEQRKTRKTDAVPDAPFKDTWYQLALKRVLKHAADNGYERVGLTTGKQQIGRFSDQLRQNVDEIQFSSGYPNKDTYVVAGVKDGNPMFQGTVVDGKFTDGVAQGKTLDEVFGKSIAKKIVSHDPSQGLGTIKGDNLSIGGEGMKKYYDEVYPQFLDKYGKKWNARVGETQITTDYARDASGIPAQRPSKESIRYIDITPEMKGAVSKGQPLFAATPALPLGAQGLLGEPEKKKELSLLD